MAQLLPPFVRQLAQHALSGETVPQFMLGLLDTSQVPRLTSLLLHRKARGSLKRPPSWPLALRVARPVSLDTCRGSDVSALPWTRRDCTCARCFRNLGVIEASFGSWALRSRTRTGSILQELFGRDAPGRD